MVRPLRPGAGLDAVAPVGTWVADAEQVPGGDVDPDPLVPAAGLQHQHRNRGIGGEPVGEHAAGGASTGDRGKRWVLLLFFVVGCWTDGFPPIATG